MHYSDIEEIKVIRSGGGYGSLYYKNKGKPEKHIPYQNMLFSNNSNQTSELLLSKLRLYCATSSPCSTAF